MKSTINSAVVVFVAVVAIVGISSLDFGETQVVDAGATHNLSGFAWGADDINGSATVNGGVGWISFNCSSDPGCNVSTEDYGVNISPTVGTGDFSGNAWSDNIGWFSFNRSDTGNPPPPLSDDPGSGVSGSAIAKINWSTGDVTGWMRALSGKDAGAGGWDGWVKLSGVATNGSLYGVKLTGNNFSGYAWGSDVLGWITFNHAFGGVVFDIGYTGTKDADAQPDSATTQDNVAGVNVELLGNDDGDEPLSIVSVESPTPQGATVTIIGTSIYYARPTGKVAPYTDVFQYTMEDGTGEDGTGDQAASTITINVTHTVVCGDGLPEGTEACDAGSNNGVTGSGCSATCQIETVTSCDNDRICDANETLRSCPADCSGIIPI